MRMAALCCVAMTLASGGVADAQLVTYEGGSIYDLEPLVSQATGDRILEQIFNSNDMQPVRHLSESDVLRKLARPVGRLAIGLGEQMVSL